MCTTKTVREYKNSKFGKYSSVELILPHYCWHTAFIYTLEMSNLEEM